MSTLMRYLEQTNSQKQKVEMVVRRDQGHGGMKIYCLTGTEIQFDKMKKTKATHISHFCAILIKHDDKIE